MAFSVLWTVPVATAWRISAPVTDTSSSVKISQGSSMWSSVSGTVTVLRVSPGAKVSVPLVDS